MKAAADKATAAAVVSAATIAELRAENLRLTEALESLRARADSEKRAAIFARPVRRQVNNCCNATRMGCVMAPISPAVDLTR